MKSKSQLTLLIVLIIFSFSIRVWHLDKNPAGFFCDEASTGIDAQNILQSGRDRHGDFLPLFFKGFNFDNVSPFQVYLTVPFVALFGMSETSVRLAPVFWSTVEILIFFFFLKEFIPSTIAIIGSLILSISPWHYHISRTNMGDYYAWTLFTLLSGLFLVKSIKTQRTIFFVLTALSMALATYAYTPARLVTPLLFSFIVVIFIIKRSFKNAVTMIIVYGFIILPFFHFHLTDPHSFQRIRYTMGIDIKGGGKSTTNLDTQRDVWKKYKAHYSDLFLFQKGDVDFPGQSIRRHSIAGIGLLHHYQKVLILFGLGFLLKGIFDKKIEYYYVLFLLIIFPVPDSLTKDVVTPFATRSYLGVLPMHMLTAFGIYWIYALLKKISNRKLRNLSLSTGGVVLISTIFISFAVLTRAFQNSPLTTSDYWGWQYGPKYVVAYFISQRNNYDELYMTGMFNEPWIFLKFYDIEGKCTKCFIGGQNQLNTLKKQLFALTAEEYASLKDASFNIRKIIYYPNGKEAFYIGEFSIINKI